MNKMKSLLLGSAVGLLAVSGAQAADLPVAEPVEYVKVCETYGAGFLYIPGTDTCLKVGGYVRFQTFVHEDNIDSDNWGGDPFALGADGTTADATNFYVRGLVNFDARTETSYGTLRSFIQIRANALDTDSESVHVDLAFLQFAGFTAGLAPSILDFATNGFFGDQIGDWNNDTVQLAYTAQFGGGVSLTAGLQSNERQGTGLRDEANDDLVIDDYQDDTQTDLPAAAAALRVNQGWGEAMIGGLVREVEAPGQLHDEDGDTLEVEGENEIGWAVVGGLKVNTPMIAKGDHIILRAAYGEGASRTIANFGYDDGALIEGVDEYEIETAKVWSVYGGYTHYWADNIRSNFVASYAQGEIDLIDEIEFSALTTSANVVWSPVKNLDVGVEVLYSDIKEEVGGVTDNDDDGFGAIFRIQRNFGN